LSVLRPALWIAALTAVVHIVTVAKDLVVAHRFGTSDALEAFLIAYLLPSVAVVFLAGSVTTSFLPAFVQVRARDGMLSAQRFYSSILLMLVLFLLAASFVIWATLPSALPYLAGSFAPAKAGLTLELATIVAPTLLPSGIAALWGCLLNASHRFALAAVSPVVVPASIMAFALHASGGDAHALAWGALLGAILQMVLMGCMIRRVGFNLIPRWHGLTDDVRATLSQYAPMVLGALMMSTCGVIDQAMAAALRPGDVAALNYGGKLVSLAATLGAMAVGTALLPLFSEQIARADWGGLRHGLASASKALALVTIPVTIVIMAFSEALIGVLFERGAFRGPDTALVAGIQFMGAIQIPFYALGILFARLLSALQMNSVLCAGAAVSLAIKVALNLAFIPVLGVAGIALSTSCMFAATLAYLAVFSWIALRRREQGSSRSTT